MTVKRKLSHRIICVFLSLALVISCLPVFSASAAADDGIIKRVADTSTMDNWKEYFYRGTDDFDTSNAGGVWTDKSVLTSADVLKDLGITGIEDPSNRGFLTVFSAVGSNMTVSGQSKVPTDTIFVVDTSGSMNDNKNNVAPELVEAMNASIKALLAANKNNRVGVVYYANDNVVGLPIGRYTTSDSEGRFFDYNIDEYYFIGRSTDEYVTINDNVYIEGTESKPSAVTREITGGTFTQGGINRAKDELLAVDDITVTDGNSTIKRKPVMILLTDGAPTRGATGFTSAESYTSGFGDGQSSTTALGFAVGLTASYAKSRIEEHYKNDSLFYTLGVGINEISNSDDQNIANYILYPQATTNNTEANTIRDRWTAYNSATVGNYVRTDADTNDYRVQKANATLDQYYVDGYFDTSTYGDNLQTALIEAFKDLVAEIEESSSYYPTLISGGEADVSGYVSFVDKLGRYMKIKDINGLIINNQLYTGIHMAQSFNEGALGTVETPTILGDNLIWSINERLGTAPDVSRSLISSAYAANQLYYNSPTDYSSYFGWYSDANGKFISFASDITTVPDNAVYTNKSYLFLGEYDETTNSYDEQPMYATIRVREVIKDYNDDQNNIHLRAGEQEVDFAVPASLIPTVTYKVVLDETGAVDNVTTNAESVSPIQFVYETELDSRINKWTAGEIVDDAYTTYVSGKGNNYTLNSDGTVNFYNNKWDFDLETGYGNYNSYSYYNPAYENDRHYFQENTYIYVKDGENFVLYEGGEDKQPSGNDKYYSTTVYYKDGAESGVRTDYVALKADTLMATKKDGNNNWYIPSTYVRQQYSEVGIEKPGENPSNTLPFYAVPHSDFSKGNGAASYDKDGHYLITATTLGNNGIITLEAEKGVKITKQLEEGTTANPDKAFTFNIQTTNTSLTSCEVYKLDAAGNEIAASPILFTEGQATVSLKAGETLYIGGMATGDKVTVSEALDTEFSLKSLTVRGAADSDGTAEVTLDNLDMAGMVFVNGTREKGTVNVTKRVTHPYGPNYTVPADKEFPIKLTFTFDGKPLAQYSFNDGYKTNQNGELDIALTNNSSKLITGIPVDTVVKVVETAPAGFTPTYSDTVGNTADGTVTVSTSTATVAIVNDYAPNPPSIPGEGIKVSGVKRFDQEGNSRLWADGDSFTFILQEYKNNWVTVSHKNATQTITIKENDGYIGTTKDYPFDFTDVFNGISYSAPGTYTYRVIEQAGAIPGVNYDITSHRFEVTVSDDDMSGTLKITKVEALENTVSVTGSYDVTATFVNDYNPSDAIINIEIHKILDNPTGSPLATREGFEFMLAEVEDFGDTVDWNASTIVDMGTTSSTGVIKFPVKFEKAGTYKYKVKEFIPTEVPAGWTYTEVIQNIVVEVTDNYGTAGLVAKAYLEGTADTSNATSTVVVPFENLYKPGSDEIILIDHEPTTVNPDFIRKNLTGRDMAAGEFSFTIYDEDNKVVYATGKNEAAKAGETVAVNFDKNLTFDTVGEFHYSIYENPTDIPGIKADSNKYSFTVTVTDSGNGYLNATLTVDNGIDNNNIVEFENSYDAEDLTYSLTGNKVFSGKALTANAFSFYIQECDENGVVLNGTAPVLVYNDNSTSGKNIIFPEVTYSAAGTHNYLIWENVPTGDKMGVIYDESKYLATVTVTDNTSTAKLEASTTYKKQVRGETQWVNAPDGITFANTYLAAPTAISISGIKAVTGGKVYNAGDYSFALYKSNASWATGEQIGTAVGNTAPNGELVSEFAFSDIDISTTGEYYYIVKEVIPKEGSREKGVTYDDTVFGIKAVVTDNGRGNLVVSEKTYFTIEAPSNKQVGGVEFVNAYAPVEGTSVTVKGNKDLKKAEGTDVNFTDFTFTFELYKANESFTPEGTPEGTDAEADGKFNFKLDYQPEDLGKTFYYVIREKNNGHGGVTYSDEEYHVTVKVLDNVKDGVLETDVKITDKDGNPVTASEIGFINNYAITQNATFSINGTKKLEGRDIKENEFKFDLYTSDSDKNIGTNPLKSAYSTSNGLFSITDITLAKAGKHYFILKEDSKEAVAKPGVTYDNTIYFITVTVKDNKDGTLSIVEAETKYERIKDTAITVVTKDELVFNNSYKASATEPINIKGEKDLNGRTLIDGEFIFLLQATDSQFVPLPNVAPKTAANNENREFQFDALTFDAAGTYYYVISEDDTVDVSRVTFDDAKYYVTITVTDDTVNGKLIADCDIKAAPDALENVTKVLFTNTYTPKPTDIFVDITVDKKVDNVGSEEITAEGFQFLLQKIGFNDDLKLTTDENGNAIFTLTFTEDDIDKTYTYKLTEVNDGKANVTYSDKEYEIQIAITLGDDNRLVATATMDTVSVSQLEAEFVNVYDYTPPTPPTPPESPKTGDFSNIHLWFALFFISGTGIFATSILGKKGKVEEK